MTTQSPVRATFAGSRQVLLERLQEQLAKSSTVDASASGGDYLVLAPRTRQEIAPLVESAFAAGTSHVVLISSAMANQPGLRHPGMVDESHAAPRRCRNSVAAAWLELEEETRRQVASGSAKLTILRPCPLRLQGSRGYFSRLTERSATCTVMGFNPSVQLLSSADLARALEALVAQPQEGTFHLVPREVAPLKTVLRKARVFRIPLPFTAHRAFRAALSPLGLAKPSCEIEYLRHSWSVSGDRASQSLGFRPRHTTLEALNDPPLPRDASPAPEAAQYDDFGMDKGYIDSLSRTFFRFLHDRYWRVEIKGLEHVPDSGRAVLVGVHRGHQPWDAVMALHLLATRKKRYPRFLIHPTLVQHPFLAPHMISCGGIHACQKNAQQVLEEEEILGIFPEGIRGAFAPYKDAYTLRKFGRDEFVKIALRYRAPIIPFVSVGTAEIFPILGRLDWSWWKRLSGWPYLPITPTMSTLPLPSKWHTEFLEPIHLEQEYTPTDSEDRPTVTRISREIRHRMETAIAGMLARRRSIFYGSIFEASSP